MKMQQDSDTTDENNHLGFKGTKCTKVDVDDIWHFIGRFGKYQMIQFTLLFLLTSWCAFPILNGIFTGRILESTCVLDNTTDLMTLNSTIKASSCYIQEVDNDTGDVLREETCSKYEYKEGNAELSYIAEWNLVCDKETLGQLPQILTMVGMLLGAFFLPPLGDRFGRKKLLIGATLGLFVALLLPTFVESFELFVFLKILSGAFEQGTTVTVFTMMIEVLPLELGFLVSLAGVTSWVWSMCMMGVVGYIFRHHPWRTIQLISGLGILPLLVYTYFTEESLRWLLGNSKEKEASAMLHKACQMNKKDFNKLMVKITNDGKDEVNPLKIDDKEDDVTVINSDQSEYGINYKTLIKSKNMRKITVVSCFTWMVCSLTYYGLILTSTSLAGDPYVNYFLGVIVEFPAAILGSFIMQKFGRKISLIYCLVISATTLLLCLLLVCFAPQSNPFTILQTCLTLIGKLFISCSFNLAWIYTPEMYPTNYRSLGIGMSSTCARVGSCFAPLFTILARKAIWAPGLMFSVGCYISALLLTMLPETRWRELPTTIEEVDLWFEKDEANKEFSQYKTPLDDTTC